MREDYNRNERLFFNFNIVLALATFVLYSMQDLAGLVLLFFFIMLVNAVFSLSFYNTLKEVKKSKKNLLKLTVSIILNIVTYVFLVLFVLKMF